MRSAATRRFSRVNPAIDGGLRTALPTLALGVRMPSAGGAACPQVAARVRCEKDAGAPETREQIFIKRETAEKTLNNEATIFKFS